MVTAGEARVMAMSLEVSQDVTLANYRSDDVVAVKIIQHGPDIKLELWKAEDQSIASCHPGKNRLNALRTLAILTNYPLMDELVKIERAFTLTITDVCTGEAVTVTNVYNII